MLLLSLIVIGLCADTAFRRYLEKKDFRQHMARLNKKTSLNSLHRGPRKAS
jgi:hypothetical protein